jgi:hypothetical protein
MANIEITSEQSFNSEKIELIKSREIFKITLVMVGLERLRDTDSEIFGYVRSFIQE